MADNVPSPVERAEDHCPAARPLSEPARSIFLFLILCVVSTFLLAIPVQICQAEQAPLLIDVHQSRGFMCSACHREAPAKIAVPSSLCIDCHGGEAKVVMRTENYDPNPHMSPHSSKLECNDCHHVHKPSVISCINCHTDIKFKKQFEK